MKIALLGYGKEGKAAEEYFLKHDPNAEIKVYQDFSFEEISGQDFSDFDLVFRSPSVHPFPGVSSMTRYFFEHCPCPIIGVTGTKGKGTTCSLIKSILEVLGRKVFLVGNIGVPSISVLDDIQDNDVVVYEMSSFQLWDMDLSPHVAVVVTIEPDHLNIHDGYEDYISAKMNIGRNQKPDDFMVYNGKNTESKRIAEVSPAKKMGYLASSVPEEILMQTAIPGGHNRDNAAAAIFSVAAYLGLSVDEFIEKYSSEIKQGLSNFKGLPHRLEFLRELNGVKYYDDNFSTNISSTIVAVDAFPENNLVMIVGGRDKTGNEDLPEIYNLFKTRENIKKIVLMGESGHELYKRYSDERFVLVESLEEAISSARDFAEKMTDAIVLMSPSAASFDMFKDVYDRGAKYQEMIAKL